MEQKATASPGVAASVLAHGVPGVPGYTVQDRDNPNPYRQ